MVLLALALLIFLSATADNKLLMYTMGTILLVIALFGPKLYLQNMIDKRKKLLQRAFPDFDARPAAHLCRIGPRA